MDTQRTDDPGTKVLLVGYSGANNTGAEALLLADIEDMRAVFGPEVRITIPRLFIDALSLNPQMIDAQFDLALALLCGKRYDLGLKEYLRGSEIAKKQSDILRRRGIISLALRSLVETADEQMGVDAKKKEEVKKILVNEMQEIRGKLEVNKERLSS